MSRVFHGFWVLCVFLAGCGSDGGSADATALCTADEVPLDSALGLTASNIQLNPHGTAPLAALLSFDAPVCGTVRVTVVGKGPDGISISHSFEDPARRFEIPVLGLYPGHSNTVVVDFTALSGATTQDILTVVTDPLPWGGPVIELISNVLPSDDDGLYLFSGNMAAIDQRGEVRWYYRGEGGQFYEQLPNGNWLGALAENPISYHSPGFAEFSMLGEKIREYSVPYYLHHEVIQLPWGNYLVASNSSLIDFATNGVPEEDTLVEIDAVTGLVIKTWDFNQILDPTRPPLPTNNRPDDWLHLNSAVYDAADNSIIITAQRQSLMAKIDYATSELRWILGAHEQWPPDLENKLLTAVDVNGQPVDTNSVDFWPYGPHAALTLGDGKFALFDNGSYRGWYANPQADSDSYSRAVIYHVDEAAMQVQIVWQYAAEPSLFTAITGDIDYLDNGNYLLGFAGPSLDTPRLFEVTVDGDVLFEAVMNRGATEYRAEKINLYRGL